MTREEELIGMLKILKEQARKSCKDTAILDVKIDSFIFVIDEAIKILDKEPKTGHWIEEDMFDGDIAYRCSECDEPFCLIDGTPTDNMYNYCPNCGCRMEGEIE